MNINAEPLHWHSQTTSATKQAAIARRKPGAEAKFKCPFCGESFTRAYNLRGHIVRCQLAFADPAHHLFCSVLITENALTLALTEAAANLLRELMMCVRYFVALRIQR